MTGADISHFLIITITKYSNVLQMKKLATNKKITQAVTCRNEELFGRPKRLSERNRATRSGSLQRAVIPITSENDMTLSLYWWNHCRGNVNYTEFIKTTGKHGARVQFASAIPLNTKLKLTQIRKQEKCSYKSGEIITVL